MTIRANGIDLHVAEHPTVGLTMAERLLPDLILLDINLPDMDGFEVKARLDANPITSDLTNEEMWNLVHMGYLPLKLVLGTAVYSTM